MNHPPSEIAATRAGSRLVLLPLTAGVLTALAYPPVSIPVLSLVGLVPLLVWLDRPLSTRQVVLGGLAFALPYFGGTSYWMFYLANFTSAGAAGASMFLLLECATFFIFPLTVTVVRSGVRVPLPLLAPLAWVVSEHARALGDLYFPWVTLGYSLSEWPFLIQHADLIGVYGISWWAVLVNTLVAGLLRRRPRGPDEPGVPVRAYAIGLTAALALPLGYNTVRWRQVGAMIARADTLPVAVIQPNVTQAFKWDPASAAATYRKVNVLIAEAEREDPALVVGPEACLPFAVSEGSTRLPAEIAAGTRPLLLGVVTGIGEGRRGKLDGHPVTVYRRHYNSALLVDADRTVLDRHDKQYLVPFTEQVPYKRVLGFVLPMMRKQFGKFVPAADLHLLTVPGQPRPVRFGALVCYESLFPALVARLRGMGADFMVNVTNDAWFGRSTFPYQHAGMSTLRAIENRVSIVRAANTGVSAFYDPLGRPGLRTGIFRNGALVGLVTLSSAGPTVLARIGHLLLVPVYGGVLLFLWLRFRAHRRGTGVDSVEALE